MRQYSLTTVLIFSIVAIETVIGCGVKGRPLPPEEPVYIGRGQDASSAVPPAQLAPIVVPSTPAAAEKSIEQKSPPASKKKPAKSKIKQ